MGKKLWFIESNYKINKFVNKMNVYKYWEESIFFWIEFLLNTEKYELKYAKKRLRSEKQKRV